MSQFQEKTTPQVPLEQKFGPQEYAEVWDKLLTAVGDSDYFNGKVECSHEGFDSVLTATIIIYRDKTHPQRPICDIVPVWWEMATYKDDREILNDFSFYALRTLAKQTTT